MNSRGVCSRSIFAALVLMTLPISGALFAQPSGGDGSRVGVPVVGNKGIQETVEQIPDAATRGVNSFKFFLAYRRRGMMIDDDAFLRAMDLIASVGGIAMVYAENGLAIDFLEKKFIAEGNVSIEWFERSRPKPVEYEAVFRAIQLAKLVVDGKAVTSDKSTLSGVTVSAEVVGHTKGPKIDIGLYKNKTGYRRRLGHRQRHTQVRVTGIETAKKQG